MTRGTVRLAGRPMLRSAMDAAVAKIAATVRQQIATAIHAKKGEPMLYEERPRKVHMFKDHAREREAGNKTLADALCRGNYHSAELQTTDVPEKVTCKRCRVELARLNDKLPDSMQDLNGQTIRELELRIELEEWNAERLYEALKLARKNIDENEHAICIMGTNITVGMVLDGVILQHEQVKAKRGEE